MSRTAVLTALVLRCRPSGESNNEVFLLTAEEGIIRATVFGGPKSKLRAFASPYNSGQVWVYRDKAKEYALRNEVSCAKLSDFDVRSWRPGLRELYERTMAAAAVSETILASHGGGGEWGTALQLAAETLDALENADDELSARLLIHFMWRWCAFLGIQPHVENCSCCAKEGDIPLWFDAREGAALCANCVTVNSNLRFGEQLTQTFGLENNERHHGLIKLNPGCRKWLSVTGDLASSLIPRYSMDHKSFSEAKALVCAVLSGVLGKRLASWDW